MIEGKLVDDQSIIEQHITRHFTTQFTEPVRSRPVLRGLTFSQISEQQQNSWLTRPFAESEVLAVLTSMPDDKSPGVDGFPMGVLKQCWPFMKHEIMTMLQDFHATGKFDWRLNTTLIALIPKKLDTSAVSDYRPISLVFSLYKILFKLLASRFKEGLSDLDSHNQSTFIRERQLLDGVLVSDELVDSRVKQKKPGILFKADFEKAYDHLNWEFLKWVLKQMGFCTKWIEWVMRCVSFTPSILINGEVKGFLKGERGIRHGDPLSPFLFTCAMQTLSLLVDKSVAHQRNLAFKYQHRELQLLIYNLLMIPYSFLMLTCYRRRHCKIY